MVVIVFRQFSVVIWLWVGMAMIKLLFESYVLTSPFAAGLVGLVAATGVASSATGTVLPGC